MPTVDSPAAPARPRPPLPTPFFYGWVIVGLCMLATCIAAFSSQNITSLMVGPILDEMKWTRTEIAAALGVGSLAGSFLAPAAGFLADRYGPRLLLTGGPGSTDRAALPGRVDWQITLEPSRPRLQLHLPCCAAQPLAFTITPGVASARLQLGASALQLPAAWLSGLGTPFNTLQLGGSLQLRTQGLDVTLAQGLAMERKGFVDAFRTEDSQIGVRSFLEHGPGKATFTGK